jgi:hypothetical protein
MWLLAGQLSGSAGWIQARLRRFMTSSLFRIRNSELTIHNAQSTIRSLQLTIGEAQRAMDNGGNSGLTTHDWQTSNSHLALHSPRFTVHASHITTRTSRLTVHNSQRTLHSPQFAVARRLLSGTSSAEDTPRAEFSPPYPPSLATLPPRSQPAAARPTRIPRRGFMPGERLPSLSLLPPPSSLPAPQSPPLPPPPSSLVPHPSSTLRPPPPSASIKSPAICSPARVSFEGTGEERWCVR